MDSYEHYKSLLFLGMMKNFMKESEAVSHRQCRLRRWLQQYILKMKMKPHLLLFQFSNFLSWPMNSLLNERKLDVKEIVTDAHTQISASKSMLPSVFCMYWLPYL